METFQNSSSFTPPHVISEGITFARLYNGNIPWLMGSVNSSWLDDLMALGSNPDKQSLEKIAAAGTWLQPENKPQKLGVMCCGMGSAWPHMGRGLYDNFPVCRKAMDKLASLADWDLLALMDEPDFEVINDTRKQIPYLFLLEFAQWNQFVSLGLNPSMLCGHSLGELAALCFAGIYSPESAWYLLDTRAEHMTELEMKAGGSGGMLAVAATRTVIDEVLRQWPVLSIANYNARKQFILGGPKKEIMEARKALRHKKIPAMTLGIGLAFHNPAMSILRGLSLRRLNALEMRAPKIPIISCVKQSLYPDNQKQICEYITDLDENTVDWPGTLDAMIHNYGMEIFLELGPRDTLCGLIHENGYTNTAIPASGKDREVEAMREACARLFAMNLLPRALTRTPIAFMPPAKSPVYEKYEPNKKSEYPPETGIILEQLARVANIPVSQVSMEMDLRHDLGLQSSRFPLLIQEIEKSLGRNFDLENLLKITTVGDLVAILTQNSLPGHSQTSLPKIAKHAARLPYFFRPYYLRRYAWDNLSESLIPLQIDPAKPQLPLSEGNLIALYLLDDFFDPTFFQDILPLKLRIAISSRLYETWTTQVGNICEIIPMRISEHPETTEIIAALESLERINGPLSGLFLGLPPAKTYAEAQKNIALKNALFEKKAHWQLAIQRMETDTTHKDFGPAYSIQTNAEHDNGKTVFWFAHKPDFALEKGSAASLLPWEIIYGNEKSVIWQREKDGSWQDNLCTSSSFFNFIKLEKNARKGDLACSCQLSSFNPLLLGNEAYTAKAPATITRTRASLPLSSCFRAAIRTAKLEAPWLRPVGFSDSRILQIPETGAGLTRELQINAHVKPWLLQEGKPTKMCRADIAVRSLYANGRAKESYEPVLNTVCLLGAEKVSPRMVWPEFENISDKIIASERLAAFFNMLGISESRRLIKEVRIAEKLHKKELLPDGIAIIRPNMCLIAEQINWQYMFFLQLIDAFFQGTLALMAFWEHETKCDMKKIQTAINTWKLSAIGYLRFDGNIELIPESMKLYIRCSWHDNKILRFDMQAGDEFAKPVMTAHHWEFERNL